MPPPVSGREKKKNGLCVMEWFLYDMGHQTLLRWHLWRAFKVQQCEQDMSWKDSFKPSAFQTPKPPKLVMVELEMGHSQWISIACLLKGVEAKTSQFKFVYHISQFLCTGTLKFLCQPPIIRDILRWENIGIHRSWDKRHTNFEQWCCYINTASKCFIRLPFLFTCSSLLLQV